MLFALLCLAVTPSVSRSAAAQGVPAVVEGRVAACNPAAGTLTVGETALVGGNATVVTLNDRPASLNDLAVGDMARAAFDPATRVASEVHASRPLAQLWGAITAYSPATGSSDATLTFRLPNGQQETLFINATTVVPVEDGGDITGLVGQNALARYDGVTRVAKEVQPGAPAPPEPEPTPTPQPSPSPVPAPTPYEAAGVLTGVDAELQTVTLFVHRGKSKRPKTHHAAKNIAGGTLRLVCDEKTQVTLNDQSATLADLARGDLAKVLFVVQGERACILQLRACLPPARTCGGVIRKVDVAGGCVVIGPAKKGLALAVTQGTRILVDGQETSADKLQPEQRCSALYVVRNEINQALAIVAISPPAKKNAGKARGR